MKRRSARTRPSERGFSAAAARPVSRVRLAAGALLALAVGLAACGGADTVATSASTADTTPTFDEAAALTTLDAYFAGVAADDTAAVVALFAPAADPAATFCIEGNDCDFPAAFSLSQYEELLTWKRAQGTQFVDASCEVAAPAASGFTLACSYDEMDAPATAAAAPPIRIEATAEVTPEGIVVLDHVTAPPDHADPGESFADWVQVAHPGDVAAINCCGWVSVDDAREEGTTTAARAADWGAYLRSIGCPYDDADCATAATLSAYVVAYNFADVDAMSVLFTDTSQLSNHPLAGDVQGIEEISSILVEERAAAAAVDAYLIVDLETSGTRASWDHVWTSREGELSCGYGHSATIIGGRIIEWTYAEDVAPCS